MGRIIIVHSNLGLELGLGLHRFRVKVRARDRVRDRVSAVQIINILNVQCTLWNAEHNNYINSTDSQNAPNRYYQL